MQKEPIAPYLNGSLTELRPIAVLVYLLIASQIPIAVLKVWEVSTFGIARLSGAWAKMFHSYVILLLNQGDMLVVLGIVLISTGVSYKRGYSRTFLFITLLCYGIFASYILMARSLGGLGGFYLYWPSA